MSTLGLSFDDPAWIQYHGGYRIPYDPRKVLGKLERSQDVAASWHELSENLYHQGDVGEVSYAAVPHLVRIHAARGVPDWNTYALVAIIEIARRVGRNPDLPASLRDDYDAAWRQLVTIGLRELASAEDPVLISCILGVVAMGKGEFTLGRFAIEFAEDERQELLDRYG